MFKTISFLIALFLSNLFGVFIEDPSETVLWEENGKDIQIHSKNNSGWDDTKMIITDAQGVKGFSVEPRSEKEASTSHKIKIDPEYSYLIFEISDIKSIFPYKDLTFHFLGRGSTGAIQYTLSGHIAKGYYVVNMFENTPLLADPDVILALYSYGMKVSFTSLKMVSQPDYYIVAESDAFESSKELTKTDKVKFSVHLKESADDVTLRIFSTRGFSALNVNGKKELQLKPKNRDATEWSIETEKTEIDTSEPIKKGFLGLRAIITENDKTFSIYSRLAYPYKGDAQ